jgi:hypothetical protein
VKQLNMFLMVDGPWVGVAPSYIQETASPDLPELLLPGLFRDNYSTRVGHI